MCRAEAFTTSGEDVSRGHFVQLVHPAESRLVTTPRTTSSMAERDSSRDMMTEF
jgi:hypothetical protein